MTLGHAQFEALFAGIGWRRGGCRGEIREAIKQMRHVDSGGKTRRRSDTGFDKIPHQPCDELQCKCRAVVARLL